MRLKKQWTCILQCGTKSEYETFPCRRCVGVGNWTICVRCHVWFNPTEKSKQAVKSVRLYMLCPQCGVYKLKSNGRIYWRRFIPEWTCYKQMRLHTERLKKLITKGGVKNQGIKWL